MTRHQRCMEGLKTQTHTRALPLNTKTHFYSSGALLLVIRELPWSTKMAPQTELEELLGAEVHPKRNNSICTTKIFYFSFLLRGKKRRGSFSGLKEHTKNIDQRVCIHGYVWVLGEIPLFIGEKKSDYLATWKALKPLRAATHNSAKLSILNYLFEIDSKDLKYVSISNSTPSVHSYYIKRGSTFLQFHFLWCPFFELNMAYGRTGPYIYIKK